MFAMNSAVAAVAPVAVDSITGLYIPGWADNTNPASLNFFNTSAVNLTGVSHMYYAFLWIDEVTYRVYDPFNNLALLRGLKSRWPATQLLLSVGGGGFSTAVWSATATTGRAAFVDSLVAAVVAAGADGVDIDWESPGAADRSAFSALAAALRSGLDAAAAAAGRPARYWLTAASPAIWADQGAFDGWDLAALKGSFDLFNIMAYEMHDPCYWETQTAFHTAWSDCSTALSYYIAQGVPARQLVLGLAFYGHTYTLLDAARYTYPSPSVESRDCSTQSTPSYRSVMAELAWGYGGGVFTDAAQRSAYYVLGSKWVGFDTEETLRAKAQGARDYGAGGVMIWDASLDVPEGRLLRAVAGRNLAGPAPAPRPCGGGYIGTGQCADASLCCSEFGYCGAGDTFCGARCRGGPCIQYPSPPPAPPQPPPACGSGTVGSGQCADASQCCSLAGWCGTGADWCGANCAGGPCWYKPSPPPQPPSPPPKPAPPPPPPVPYGCGEGLVGNGTCAGAGQCCSAAGWCGEGADYCGLGCQGGPCVAYPPPPPGALPLCGGGVVNGGYCANDIDHCYWYCIGGPCQWPPPPPQTGSGPAPPETPPETPCGNGVIGNGRCESPGLCCSAAGWCGDSPDHCLFYCVGGRCWSPPPPPATPAVVTAAAGTAAKAPPPSPPPPPRGTKSPTPKHHRRELRGGSGGNGGSGSGSTAVAASTEQQQSSLRGWSDEEGAPEQ
ncbi:hypothetical protein HXX76_009744 [Chlamydomonas incerta]|uniref:Chitinase n=1 Tax=Chlamydomonas incerta TaxID=51695 RepID=A0A835W011_CHLIN|nr:hypothetical protein HXX76_009744 [Chlamydomonas incerta]|eukprot:KAG2431216.1 hypothetical protein HXX76_009744 [Chlamydomonas incerta]